MGKAQENPPSKGVPERQRGWGMFVRLLDNLWVNPINIPLLRFAFATLSPFEGGIPDVAALPDLIVKEHKSAATSQNKGCSRKL